MNKQKSTGISYCNYTSNPITGCLHACFYCWAQEMCYRFNRSFKPAFHPEELLSYAKLTMPRRRIFICDASDMWGKWVPDLWIDLVLTACRDSWRQDYLFLTKNPARYQFFQEKLPDGSFIGTSMTGGDQGSLRRLYELRQIAPKQIRHYITGFDPRGIGKWVSLEPLFQDPSDIDFAGIDWVVIGAMTGRNRAKYPCKDIWVQTAIDKARDAGAKVYIKGNLVKRFPIRELP